MILTKDLPTTAGSEMLDGYVSLFEAEVLTRLEKGGYTMCSKAENGEFSIDVLGETSFKGAVFEDGKLTSDIAEKMKSCDADFAIVMDINGSPRRAAAQNSLVCAKATYGTVSRFGTIPVVCSGETVSVLAKTSEECKEALKVIAGHDDKDGTSLSEEDCEKINSAKKIRRIALLKSMKSGIDGDVLKTLEGSVCHLKNEGYEVEEVDDSVICRANIAWNVLMCAELCNNVSRYDGVKYGYRSNNFSNIDELYTNSRTEAFGSLLKTAILYGSEALSTENYFKVYDKALRVRRVISEEFKKIFEKFDAVLIPAVSKAEYRREDFENNPYIAFEENYYTAPASITGLPAVTFGTVQLVGPAFSELALLDVAAVCGKEGK